MTGEARPRLAVLFWFYKSPELCRERVALLRRLNPGTPIYGLYGGGPEGADAARRVLGRALDDLFLFTRRDANWRWIHGDQVIAAWMRERGRSLPFDTLVVVQWDMLLLEPLDRLLADLRPGEALFTGDRPLEEVAPWWGWAGGRDPERAELLAVFTRRVREDWGYRGPLHACLFILACLPRAFLERYVAEGPPEEGFLEYKLSTLARAWGAPVRPAPRLAPWWASEPGTRDAPRARRFINASGEVATPAEALDELARADGARAFHPYEARFPPALLHAGAARAARVGLKLAGRA